MDFYGLPHVDNRLLVQLQALAAMNRTETIKSVTAQTTDEKDRPRVFQQKRLIEKVEAVNTTTATETHTDFFA
jgi:hypothetical protein